MTNTSAQVPTLTILQTHHVAFKGHMQRFL
jgi:hypothetical protein